MRSGRATIVMGALVLLASCRSNEPARNDPQAPPPQAAPVPASAVERARAHTELGASYLQIGRLAVALQELEEALKADPKYSPAHTTLGLVHMELKEDDKARASFERALKFDPADSSANNSYGMFLCNRGKEKDSIRFFLAALKNPLYATPEDSFVNAGICSRRGGDLGAAQLYFERALSARADDPRALINLAQLHYERDQINLAKSFLTRFMQQTREPDPVSLWLGVRIERKLGDQAGMASYSSQLKTRFPNATETQRFNEGRFE